MSNILGIKEIYSKTTTIMMFCKLFLLFNNLFYRLVGLILIVAVILNGDDLFYVL